MIRKFLLIIIFLMISSIGLANGNWIKLNEHPKVDFYMFELNILDEKYTGYKRVWTKVVYKYSDPKLSIQIGDYNRAMINVDCENEKVYIKTNDFYRKDGQLTRSSSSNQNFYIPPEGAYRKVFDKVCI